MLMKAAGESSFCSQREHIGGIYTAALQPVLPRQAALAVAEGAEQLVRSLVHPMHLLAHRPPLQLQKPPLRLQRLY